MKIKKMFVIPKKGSGVTSVMSRRLSFLSLVPSYFSLSLFSASFTYFLSCCVLSIVALFSLDHPRDIIIRKSFCLIFLSLSPFLSIALSLSLVLSMALLWVMGNWENLAIYLRTWDTLSSPCVSILKPIVLLRIYPPKQFRIFLHPAFCRGLL